MVSTPFSAFRSGHFRRERFIINPPANMKTLQLIPTLIASVLAAHAAQATVLYHDNFTSATPAAALSGSTPDTTIGSNTWKGSTLFRQDGVSTVTGGNAAVWLPITLSGESTYEFTLNLDLTAGANTNWVAMGFTNDVAATPGMFTDVGATWMLLRRNAQTSAWGGPGTANNQWVNNAATGVTIGTNLTLTLRVTTGATAANSTVDMFVNTFQLDLNGAAAGSSREGVNLSSVTNFGIGASSTSSGVLTFQNFTAEVTAIPEPSTWAMVLGGGSLFVSMVGRRRR